jgi:hypothetical protein
MAIAPVFHVSAGLWRRGLSAWLEATTVPLA